MDALDSILFEQKLRKAERMLQGLRWYEHLRDYYDGAIYCSDIDTIEWMINELKKYKELDEEVKRLNRELMLETGWY